MAGRHHMVVRKHRKFVMLSFCRVVSNGLSMDPEKNRDSWMNYSNHADSGSYSTKLEIKTSDEETYHRAQQLLSNLITDINNSEEIPPDQKRQITDILKTVANKPSVAIILIELLKKCLAG